MPDPDAPQPTERRDPGRPDDERPPAEEARDQDPDAPGIGATEGGDEIDDLPEPQEPA